jgi:hypothetical protein
MASIFRREHDVQGREVIEIGLNTHLFLGLAVAMPAVFIAGAYYALGDGPQGVPSFLLVVAILFAVAACALVAWMGRLSSIRVTIDGNTGRLFVRTSDGESELRMADVSKAEFAASTGSEGSALTRLELVLKSGERMATSAYSSVYTLAHQTAAVKVINAALGRQMI